MKPRTICINMYLAPGDITVLTALVRDLKTTYPEHRIFVDTAHSELWQNNPHCKRAAGIVQAYPDCETVKIHYGQGIRGPNGQKFRTIHFLRYLYEDFYAKTGINVPTHLPRGDFHFSPDEASRLVPRRYWILLPGGKSDFPVKIWDPARFQAVVDHLRGLGLKVVQLGGTGSSRQVSSINPKLTGVIDLVGRTSHRDVLRLIRDADGVLGGVSYGMHAAAALERPCVVIAGGREAWWWEAYVRENKGFMGGEANLRVPHRFLHTIGILDCVDHMGGCWKCQLDRTMNQPCRKVVQGESGPVPECLRMISVELVVEQILSYYVDGTLPAL